MRFAPGTDPEVIRRAEEVFYGKRRQDQPMQAAPSAQQALPQPQMPPELQRLQDMSNALGKRIQSDPSMQRFQEQQRQIYSNIQQKTQNYINSLQQFLNTAPPEFRQFLSSPQTLSRLRMAYGEQLPEMNQVRNIGRQVQQYHQNTFGQEIQKIQQLQMQAAPQIQQYQYQMQLFNQQQSTALANAQQQIRELRGQTPTIVRNDYDYLPEGLTQEQFMRQVRGNMDQQYRTPEQMREYFKPLYDSYLKEKALEKNIAERIQPSPIQAQPTANKEQLSYFPPDANYEIRGNSVYMNGRNIGSIGGSRGMNDPSMLGLPNDRSIKIPAYVFDKATYTENKDVRTTLPPSNILNNVQAELIKKANEEFREGVYPRPVQPVQQDPIVDPLRPSTTVPKTITPIERPPVQPIVDPAREPFVPKPEVDPSETLPPPTRVEKPTVRPIVDPKRPIKPADTTGVKHSGQGLGGQGGLPSVTPIKGSGPKMIVDPLRPTTSVPKHSGEGIGGQGGIPAQPIGDPIKINTPTIVDPYAPTTTGLMPKSPKKRKAGLAPSQYRGIDTNVRGLMRQ